MKKRILALALVLILAAGLLPLSARAAAVCSLPEPVSSPMALPGLPAPLKDTYTITLTSTGSGRAELYNKTAGAGESIYFLADPDPGYRVSFDKCGYTPDPGKDPIDIYLKYIGLNIYELKMPAGDVVLDLEFVKIGTASHNVTLAAVEGGMVSVSQKTAKKGESLFIEVVAGPGYTLDIDSVVGKSKSGSHTCYHLGNLEGAELYEVFMPNEDLEIRVVFDRNGPYDITTKITGNGTVSLSPKPAYELQTVTVTAKPARGHKVSSISCKTAKLTKVRENVWSFPMPNAKEELSVTFVPVVYSVSVTTEVPMGGTASLDLTSGTIGQAVTLTCVPEEGYRVARITGVKNLTDNGDNTYSFTIDNADLSLKVLFLRHENPFLDVNETHFFYDSVLWAAREGITSGVSATDFGPFAVCNRAQVVTFLWRWAGSPEPASAEHPFTDVPAGSWYEKPVLWALENGITNGLTETTFGPESVCNRAQVVTFLHRTCGSPQPELTETGFSDVEVDGWYETPVLWALENGITNGATGTTFGPAGECLRAHVVIFLHRADQLPEPEPEPEPTPEQD